VAKANDNFLCRATLTVGNGQERLATRNFVAVDEAADWALLTAQRLKLALGAQAYDKIDDALAIDIGGHIPGDPISARRIVFTGSLAAATAGLADRVRVFERDELPQFRREVASRIAVYRRRKYWIAAGGAGALAAAVIAVLLFPPILDPERAAEAILSGPPPALAGRWALGNPATNCQTNFVEFSARRYEAVVGASRQNFAAAYSQPTPDTMRVEYAQGGIRLIQTFRLPGENGRMVIANVESSDPEIAAAARRAIGTVLTKCPSTAAPQ
jgi:hypothetical protein